MKYTKPWLNVDGSSKSEEEIQMSCKDWCPEDWEEYLKTFEGELEEEVLEFPIKVEEYSFEDHKKFLDDTMSVNEFPMLESNLLEAMRELTLKQQIVLREYFWERRKMEEIRKNNRSVHLCCLCSEGARFEAVGSSLFKTSGIPSTYVS